MQANPQTEKQRSRLSEAREEALLPWVPASTLKDCFLYWLPFPVTPLPHTEREWLLTFYARLEAVLSEQAGLRSEIFLQFKTITTDIDGVQERFRRYAMTCHNIMGLSRRPGSTPPPMPTAEQLEASAKGGRKFDINDWVSDYCYWFLGGKKDQHRKLFMGLGGMTTIFLPPDPKTSAPKLPFTPKYRAAVPALEAFDLDGAVNSAYSLKDGFLPLSKQLFGAGLEERAEFVGIKFILPLLESGHFFAAKPEERDSWFQLFDVYLNESTSDKGLVLAFKKDFESKLIEIVQKMKEDGLVYGRNR